MSYLWIGDSFTERLYKAGKINKDDTVLAKYGTGARDWYDCVGNDRFVDFASQLYALKQNAAEFEGILFLYGINDIKYSWNAYYAKRLITELATLFPDTTVWVQRVFPVATTYHNTANTYSEINKTGDFNVKKYNKEIKHFCDHESPENVIWVDTTEGFITSYGNLKTTKTEDGLHIANKYLDQWLDNIFAETGYSRN